MLDAWIGGEGTKGLDRGKEKEVKRKKGMTAQFKHMVSIDRIKVGNKQWDRRQAEASFYSRVLCVGQEKVNQTRDTG